MRGKTSIRRKSRDKGSGDFSDGQKLSDQHYGWIVVITRRTTRTRA